MLTLFIQLAVVVVWSAVLITHTRRLIRMTLAITVAGPHRFRQHMSRAWWWLGRDEFWAAVQRDVLHGGRFTLLLLVFLLFQ